MLFKYILCWRNVFNLIEISLELVSRYPTDSKSQLAGDGLAPKLRQITWTNDALLCNNLKLKKRICIGKEKRRHFIFNYNTVFGGYAPLSWVKKCGSIGFIYTRGRKDYHGVITLKSWSCHLARPLELPKELWL